MDQDQRGARDHQRQDHRKRRDKAAQARYPPPSSGTRSVIAGHNAIERAEAPADRLELSGERASASRPGRRGRLGCDRALQL
jgi:hypothetical protein